MRPLARIFALICFIYVADCFLGDDPIANSFVSKFWNLTIPISLSLWFFCLTSKKHYHCFSCKKTVDAEQGGSFSVFFILILFFVFPAILYYFFKMKIFCSYCGSPAIKKHSKLPVKEQVLAS